MLLLVIFCMPHYSTGAILQITDHEYPMMDGIKHISDELFPIGQPLVIALPLVEDESTKIEVDYLIKELHNSSRWPTIVMNITYEMNVFMRIEINQPGSYVILISGNCHQFTNFINDFTIQLYGLSAGAMWQSWNARAWFVIAVMTPCKHYDNTFISKAILGVLWTDKITNVVVVFKETSGYVSNFHQQKSGNSESQVLFSLHTWFPYENLQSCDPNEGNVPLHTFLIRNLSDIEYIRKLKEVRGKKFHRCPISVLVFERYPFVPRANHVWHNDSQKYVPVYGEGLDLHMIGTISRSLNLSILFQEGPQKPNNLTEGSKELESVYNSIINSRADVIIGGLHRFIDLYDYFEGTHGYLHAKMYILTPCAVKLRNWDRIFKIFSREVWIAVTLSLVFSIITVNFITFYAQNIHLNEGRTYGNVPSITSNVTSIALGVSVATQPRTAPLRLFFLSWVCYSIAISTVFQAFFTTFLIEPGYEEPIKESDQLLNNGRNVGWVFTGENNERGLVECPDYLTCFLWAMQHQNISAVTLDYMQEVFKSLGYFRDENNRPLLCETEDGDITNLDYFILVSNGHFLLEYFNKIIDHIVEAGLPKKWLQFFYKSVKIYMNASMLETNAYTYLKVNVTHLQPALYLLLLGYILSLFSFIFEIIFYYQISKRRCLTYLSASTGAV